jgi:hypothetical protein
MRSESVLGSSVFRPSFKVKNTFFIFLKKILAPLHIGASLGLMPTNGVCGPLEQEAGISGDKHF